MITPEAQLFDQINSLLDSVTAEDATKRIDELDDVIDNAQREQAKWRTLLGLKQQLGEADSSDRNGGGKPTLRQAIRRVFDSLPPGTALKLSDLGKQLQERGWLDASEKDQHRLQMMASTMKKQNQLERPQMGYYRLPLSATPEGEERET